MKTQKWCTLPQKIIPHFVANPSISLPTSEYGVCICQDAKIMYAPLNLDTPILWQIWYLWWVLSPDLNQKGVRSISWCIYNSRHLLHKYLYRAARERWAGDPPLPVLGRFYLLFSNKFNPTNSKIWVILSVLPPFLSPSFCIALSVFKKSLHI